MKPCDCKSMRDVSKLEEQGVSFNNYQIEVDSGGVLLTIDPYCRIKIHNRCFKRFAEWYLSEQAPPLGEGF